MEGRWRTGGGQVEGMWMTGGGHVKIRWRAGVSQMEGRWRVGGGQLEDTHIINKFVYVLIQPNQNFVRGVGLEIVGYNCVSLA